MEFLESIISTLAGFFVIGLFLYPVYWFIKKAMRQGQDNLDALRREGKYKDRK
ncbi:hypothetical protein [Thiomicrorhabdus chilensis]|uniref:hypothetical protein n=1 Tax=Thiomicrorhabdus chilensis TaxID=63656 RepID=UPI0012FE5993|nr:hypothetical protein [Thiomicrorhabdus chilensis]